MHQQVFRPADCWKCTQGDIYNRSICRAAGENALRELDRMTRTRDYAKGQVIITEGDQSSFVGNVVSGVVKLTNTSSSGGQQIVGLLYPSDFFGRAYSDEVAFSYEAATDVTLCIVDRHAFEAFLERYPEIKHELLVTTLDELDAVREWSALMASHTTMERLCSFLYILARRSGGQHCLHRDTVDHPVINLPIGRRDIAAYIGTTAETLSRNIRNLVRSGVLRPVDNSNFELLDGKGLVERAGESSEDLDELTGLGQRD